MPDVPLWNPHIVGGHPFQANAQSSVFGPYTLPAYVLPFWTALGWIAVLKLWVAAFGTFLLARALGMRYAGALLAGLVFALNLKLVTWLTYPAMSVWSLIPWLLLATDRLVRRPGLLSGAGLAAVVGLQFLAGHPESSFHALLAAVAFFALRLWQRHRRAGVPLAPAAPRLRRRARRRRGARRGHARSPSRSCSGCPPTCTTDAATRSTSTSRSRTPSGLPARLLGPPDQNPAPASSSARSTWARCRSCLPPRH